MTDTITNLVREAEKLSPVDRAALICALLVTLDVPDPAIEAAWAAEVEDRIDAIDRGEMTVRDISEVRYSPRGK